MKPWCIRAKDGMWCQMKEQKYPKKADEFLGSVPTACNQFIVLPWGLERRDPTCPMCLEMGDDLTGKELFTEGDG